MTKRLLVLALVAVCVALGCSARRTRQFIAEDVPANDLRAGDWVLDRPSVIAFKDVIDLDNITDTTMFWISMRAKKLKSLSRDDLSIDSVKISFWREDGSYWRYPTRSADYDSEGDKYAKKTIEFFGNQGIVIPARVYRIFLEFEAVTAGVSYPFKFEMIRDEKARRLPILRQ